MKGIVRRIHLLAALALLFSGLLQPLAAAQGVTCARTHSPGQEARQSASVANDGPQVVSVQHQHGSIPEAGAVGAPSVPCGGAAIPSEQRLPSLAITTRQRLHMGDLPPASLLTQSVFRPPRLS